MPKRLLLPPAAPSPGFSDAAFRRTVAESVATAEPDALPSGEEHTPAARSAERIVVREADTSGATVTKPGRLMIRLIRSGWSLNGNFYPPEVLRRDGSEAWPAGTQCFVDHATDEEDEARPSGSIRSLAAVTTTAARWDEAEQALMAEAKLFAPWREPITEMASHIGMSIRAWVTGEHGEREGQSGFIVQSIPEGRSVDFVTKPAAGGGIVSVLESVGNQVPATEARNVAHWFEARLHADFTNRADDMFGNGRLTRDERITLSSAVGDALTAFAARVAANAPQLLARDLWEEPEQPTTAQADEAVAVGEAPTEETRTALNDAVRAAHPHGDGHWSYVRDFDPARLLVWFEVSDSDGVKTWQQAYLAGTGSVALTGEPVEVVARITYQPVAAPAYAGEAAQADTPTTAPAVTETVTDGAPPTAPNPPEEKEPAMSGTTTGTPPVEAGTAPVADTATTTAAPAVESVQQSDVRTVAALEAVTAQLAQMQAALTAVQASNTAREAENRALRNRNRAAEAVTAALRAVEHADVAAQIGPRVSARILDAVPTTAEGVVDDAALTTAISAVIADEAGYVRAARAEALEAAGVGQPYGLGSTARQEAPDDGFDTEMTKFFSDTLGLTEAQARIAAQGRN